MDENAEPDPSYRDAFAVGQVRFRDRLIELLVTRKMANLEASGWQQVGGKLVPTRGKIHPDTRSIYAARAAEDEALIAAVMKMELEAVE